MAKLVSRRRFLQLVGSSSIGIWLGAAGCAPKGATAPSAQPGNGLTASPVPASGETPAAAPGGPKILRVRLYGDIQNLDPAFRISNNDEIVANAVMEGLVRYGPNSYDRINQLVESIEQSEDGLTISFKLKEGVMWHKGYGEVTAEDVKFSYERIADPAVGAAYADDWATLDHVEVVDKYRGKIVLSEPFAPLWRTTLPIMSGNVVCKKYVQEVGHEAFATNIIGTGPYMFEGWQPKQQVTLKRNPEYHGEAPHWDEIHFIPIEDHRAAEVALEAGELDFAWISIASMSRYEGHPEIRVWSKPSLRYRWIGMNVEHPKLQDINVRLAIRYAIDVPSILAATYMGQAEQQFSLIPPGLIGHWKDAPRYARDVEKAKGYMAKAGLQSLDLRLDLEDTIEYRTWGEIAQQNLKEIGINLELNPMDDSSYYTIGAREMADKLELFTDNFTMEPDPSWATMWFSCEQIDVWNWMRWCSPEFDELHKKGLITMDEKERDAIYIQMQQLWDEACHTVWISHGVQAYGYSRKIQPATTPHGNAQPQWFLPA